MRVVIQRVDEASVYVENRLINKICEGLLVFVGFTTSDTIEDINYLVKKIINLRIFNDENNLMNKSILDLKKEILSISQFTLYADTKSGNRPSFKEALAKEEAEKLYKIFNDELNKYIKTFTGVFGADMKIKSVNNGPVTINIDSKIR